jgi:hypothetical protein
MARSIKKGPYIATHLEKKGDGDKRRQSKKISD